MADETVGLRAWAMLPRLGALPRAIGASALLGTLAQGLPATVAWRRARVRALPRLSGCGRDGHLALTFDDGPDPVSTPLFLEALSELGVRATFFMLGEMADASPSLVEEVASEGHEIALHGWRHSNHLVHSPRWVTDDTSRTLDLLSALSGQQPRFCRPPYGILATSTLIGAHRAGLEPVLWTTWGRDWRKDASPASIVADASRTMVPSPTVLLHDSDCTSSPGSWKATLSALPMLAEMWSAAGLDVGPLAEHF